MSFLLLLLVTHKPAPCGVVVDYRVLGQEIIVTDRLESCWWGAIAE